MKGASSIPKHEMNKGGKASENILKRCEMRKNDTTRNSVAGDNVLYL